MKIKKIIMSLLLVVGLLFVPNVYAADDIVIQSVAAADSSKNAVFDQNPQVSGLTISFRGITFKDKGDFVRYKVIVANNSNEDYEINNGTAFSDSKYFKYEFEFTGDNNIVPKKSMRDMYIKISYNEEVPMSAFNDNGTFREENEMKINLTNKVNNPKTGTGIALCLVLIFLVTVGSIATILTNKTKLNKHFIMIVAMALAIIPVTIYAAKMITINLDTEIMVDRNYHFYIVFQNQDCSTEPVGELEDQNIVDHIFNGQGDSEYTNIDCYNNHKREKFIYTDTNMTAYEAIQTIGGAPNDVMQDFYYNSLTNKLSPTDKIVNGGIYYYYYGTPYK